MTQSNSVVYDPVIRVDRSNRFVYAVCAGWMKEIVRPELENVGPAEYDLAKVELYIHDDQQGVGKRMTGTQLYEHLKESDTLKECLGLHDALGIQKKGADSFLRFFGDKTLYCWKSVARNHRGDLLVPCVHNHNPEGFEVVVSWFSVDSYVGGSSPAARFAN